MTTPDEREQRRLEYNRLNREKGGTLGPYAPPTVKTAITPEHVDSTDYLHISGMLSYPAWKRYASRRGYEWFQPFMEPQWVAWWIEVLKQSDDSPDLFPHGKWASIQYLQGKLAAIAAGERFSEESKP